MSVVTLASAISIPTNEIVTDTHLPQVASIGLPFLVAELRDQSTLKRARANLDTVAIRIPNNPITLKLLKKINTLTYYISKN